MAARQSPNGEPLRAAERSLDPDLIANPEESIRFGRLIVHVYFAAAASLLRIRARPEQAGHIEPDVKSDGVRLFHDAATESRGSARHAARWVPQLITSRLAPHKTADIVSRLRTCMLIRGGRKPRHEGTKITKKKSLVRLVRRGAHWRSRQPSTILTSILPTATGTSSRR
jgi:hypothetical protein